MIWFDYALIGLLAGFLAGYLGIGGGLILVPTLSWLFARDPATAAFAIHLAVATSLATMLLTSLSSIRSHHRRGAVLWPVVLTLAPGLAAGAIGGAMLAVQISTGTLAAVFGVYAALAGVQLISGKEIAGEKPLPGPLASSLTGLVIGAVSSLVGIGGGSMTVPWLLWHGRAARQSIATAAACGYPIALAGTLTFILLGNMNDGGSHGTGVGGFVHLPALAGVVVFSVLAAPMGVAAVHKSPPGLVRRIFGVFLLLVAVKMILQA